MAVHRLDAEMAPLLEAEGNRPQVVGIRSRQPRWIGYQLVEADVREPAYADSPSTANDSNLKQFEAKVAGIRSERDASFGENGRPVDDVTEPPKS